MKNVLVTFPSFSARCVSASKLLRENNFNLIIKNNVEHLLKSESTALRESICAVIGFAPIFPDTCYHLTHHWPTAADIPVASDNPAHYADAIRYNARTPLQGSLLPLTRLVWA